MTSPIRANTYAAVDLGSNSFHLLVARRDAVLDPRLRVVGDHDGVLQPGDDRLHLAHPKNTVHA